jgi:hypothetical protein
MEDYLNGNPLATKCTNKKRLGGIGIVTCPNYYYYYYLFIWCCYQTVDPEMRASGNGNCFTQQSTDVPYIDLDSQLFYNKS